MLLKDGTYGREYAVADICLAPRIVHRLEVLGLVKGARVIILGKKRKGPVIIKVRGTRFAIGRKMADGIHIEVVYE
ncbi:MAG: FeoA domain-containing protein [Clostridia bacterium]|nr:FeoA domain-containing protein [Clostridia bacterium]